jgi:hypothetical protein
MEAIKWMVRVIKNEVLAKEKQTLKTKRVRLSPYTRRNHGI